MARSLNSNLNTAVNAITRAPSIGVQIEDQTAHYISYQAPANADQQHDACVANDGSIIRVTITRGGTGFDRDIKSQRITDPTIAGQWNTWLGFTGGVGNMFQDGGVCVVNDTAAGVLRVFGQQGTGGNALFCWTSATNGASWTGPVTVLSPPGGALTKGIASAGNNDVFFQYDVLGGEQIGASFYSAGWGALVTATLPVVGAGGGLGVAWTGVFYAVAYSDSYSIFFAWYQSGVWTQLTNIASATSTAVGRLYPHLTYFDSVYHCTCVETDLGTLTGVTYSYARVRESSDLVHWSNGWILHALPNTFGATIIKNNAPQTGSAGARYYAITMAAVYSALVYNGNNAAQFLDVSARVLMFKRWERGEKPGELELVLDNQGGALNGLIYDGSTTADVSTNFQPISYNASVILNEGYKVGGPPPTTPDQIVTGTYRINQYILERTPEENQVRIIALDYSRELDAQCRWQMSYSNQSVAWLVAEICARAGLLSWNIPATTNTGQGVPAFVLHAGTTYRSLLNDLCDTYGLWYFMDQTETIVFVEKNSGSDPTVWNYHPEWEIFHFGAQDPRANHIIVSGKPPTGGSPFALTEGEAYDDVHNQLVKYERLIHHVDMKLTSHAQCNAKAASLMAEEQRLEANHLIEVPANPALQMYDGVGIQDSSTGGTGRSDSCRIIQSIVQYDAQTATYEQHLALEGL